MVSCSGLLVQSCCGEGGVLQADIAGLCGEHLQSSGHTGFAPLTGVCSPCLCCSGSRLHYIERALRCVRVVPVFQYSTKVRTRLPLCFVSSLAARSLMGTLSPGAVHLLPSVAPASVSVCTVGCMRLVFSRDPPGGCRPSRISGSLWLETGGLFAVW